MKKLIRRLKLAYHVLCDRPLIYKVIFKLYGDASLVQKHDRFELPSGIVFHKDNRNLIVTGCTFTSTQMAKKEKKKR